MANSISKTVYSHNTVWKCCWSTVSSILGMVIQIYENFVIFPWLFMPKVFLIASKEYIIYYVNHLNFSEDF